jgi:hypothetical protein
MFVGVAAHRQRKGGLHRSLRFALGACISEGVLYMNCLYWSHFQHHQLIPSLWRARLHVFDCPESKGYFYIPGATLASNLCKLEKRLSFRLVAPFNLVLDNAGAEYV